MTQQDLRVPVSFENREGKLNLLGVPLFTGSMRELLGEIRDLVDSRGKHLIVTPNVDQVLNLRDDAEFRNAYTGASIRPVDGTPLAVVGQRVIGEQVHRNTGADLLPKLCKDDRFAGLTVALVGGPPEASRAAAETLSANGVSKVVSIATPFKPIEDEAYKSVVQELNDLHPDVVFIGMGSPRQEKWYLHWMEHLSPAVYIGSGAAYAFASGELTRAPQWMQKSGLEWLHRLASEPKRLAYRYLVKGPAYLSVARRSFKLERRRRKSDVEFISSAPAPWGAEHSLALLLGVLTKDTGQRIGVTCQSSEVSEYFSRVEGVKVTLISPGRNRFTSGLRLLRRTRAKTVVVFSLDLLPTVPFGRLLGRRMIIDLHDYPQQRHVRVLVRLFSTMANGTIAISRFTARLASKRGTTIVQRPFEQNLRPIQVETLKALRVGVVGRLDPDKGHHLALDAFQSADPRLKLVFVGAGSTGQEDYANGLIAAGKELGERFTYRGKVETERVFDGLDALLVTNHKEAAGRTVVEAMIAGLPVVVPDSGGAMEYVEDGVSGWYYRSEDPLSLLEVLEELLETDPESVKRRLESAQAAAQRLSPEAIGSTYMRALKTPR